MCNDCVLLIFKIYKYDIKKNFSFIKLEKLNVKRKFSFIFVKFVKRKCLIFIFKYLILILVKFIKLKIFRKEGFKDKVCRYIKDLYYDYVLRIMMKKSKCVRDVVMNVLRCMIKKEVKNVNILFFKILLIVKFL